MQAGAAYSPVVNPPWSPPAATRLAQLRLVGTSFLKVRPMLVAPALLAALALVAPVVPRRQLLVLTVGFTTMLGFFVLEAVLGARRLVTARALFVSLLATLGGVSFGCMATGGLGSPLLPMMLAPAVVGFAAFGRARQSLIVVAALTGLLVALACLPDDIPFPPLPRSVQRWLLGGAVLEAGLLAWVGVSRLTDAYARAGAALAGAGEEMVAAAEARIRALESLGAQVAHEIKNPLAAIKGLVEVTLEQTVEHRARTRLEVVRGEVARIEAILGEYLSFARPTSELSREPTDIERLVRAVCALLEVRAERAGLILEAAGPPLTAHVDGPRLKEALLNLLLNAFEATAAGGAVRVTWRGHEGWLRLEVRDQGRGMSASDLARLGESFTTRPGGTGLGVRLARRVAERHAGALTFDSAPGRGTTASLTVPLTPA